MLPEPKRKEILPGVFLSTLQTEKFKTNRFSVHFIFPLRRELVPYYAMLPGLLQLGCRQYPTMRDLSCRTDELYAADLSVLKQKKGESEVFSFTLEVLRNCYTDGDIDVLQEGISLLQAVMTDPVLDSSGENFPADRILTEQKNLLVKIRSLYNNKAAYAMDLCRQRMCEGEAYAVPSDGTEELVTTMDTAALFRVYREMLRTARVECLFIGDEPEEKIVSLLLPLAEWLGAREVGIPETEKRPARPSVQYVEVPDDTVQSKLSMGYRFCLPDKRLQAGFPLFNIVLSSSPVAKLFKNVREKKSLCYYCSLISDREKQVGFVNAGIDGSKKEETVAAVQEQFREMAAGHISDEEMDFAKKSFSDTFLSACDNALGIESICLNFILKNQRINFREWLESSLSATVEDLSSIAKAATLDTVVLLRGQKKETAQGEGEEDVDV